jgi:hypothetical protein
VTVVNSTFSGNTSPDGGAIVVTILGSTAHLAGNIFKAGASGDNCAVYGTLNDNGYNLSDDGTCTNGGTGSATNATLNLGALSGGVHTPQAGSDAVGAIPNGTSINNNGVTLACNGTTTDQSGSTRPITSGDDCTSGAVEVTPICTSWTVATADELYNCIAKANGNSTGLDTITLSAGITLTTLTTSPLPTITTGITLEGAGYVIDGGNSVRIFKVSSVGNLTVNQATLQNGSATVSGGGIENYGVVTVTRSTLSGNIANSGGGIYNEGTLVVTNSTFSGNTASDGGGIENEGGTLTVSYSTFSGNAAPGNGGSIVNWSGGTVNLAGNIFEAGANGENCYTVGGTLNDNGYNLSSDTSCVSGGAGSVTDATLKLGSLADNGGDTLTHALPVGSPAIDAIPNGSCSVGTDQRGISRPQGSACDSGAFELDSGVDVYLPIVVKNN